MMARLGLMGAVALLSLQVARCDNIMGDALEQRGVPRNDNIEHHWKRATEELTNWDNIHILENGLVPGEVPIIPDIKYKAPDGSMPVDGRALISEWLNPRGGSKRSSDCVNPAYEVCADQSGCCRNAAACCPNSRYCKIGDDDVCCGSLGTCSAGYFCSSLCECVATGGSCCSNGRYCAAGKKCCSLGGCAEVGGECCSNGRVCSAGNICVISGRTGQHGCCTDLSCTAWVSSGVTIPLTPTAPVVPSRTASPPIITTPPDVIYVWYYQTITWYYYSYYFTYYIQIEASTLTSTYITETTTISVRETASSAADSRLSAISESLSEDFTAPAAATTALALSTNVIGGSSTSSSNNGLGGLTGLDGLGPTATGGAAAANDQPSPGRVQASLPSTGLVWALVCGVVAVGWGMVWL